MSQDRPDVAPSLCPPRRRWWRDVILGCLIFVCGFLAGGAAVVRFHATHPAGIERFEKGRAFARLKRSLHLTDSQATQVRDILIRGMSDLRQVRQSVRPQVDSTLQRVREDVGNVLDERQRATWNSRFDMMRERWFPAPPEMPGKDAASSPEQSDIGS